MRRVFACIAVLGIAGCGGDRHQDRTSPPTVTGPPTTSSGVPLENSLLWLLSPTGGCPPWGSVLVETSDDPALGLLQALGLASNTEPACQPNQDGP
jgi:hypothetical protein